MSVERKSLHTYSIYYLKKMKRLTFLSIVLLLFAGSMLGQTIVMIDGIPRDTTFTLHRAYVKEKKNRAYIEMALPQLPSNVAAYENIVYSKPKKDRELLLNLYRPKDNKKYPALIMVFGGGWSSGNLWMEVPMAQQIAKQGYVTIPVEYRLSPEDTYPAAVYDLKTAVRWARANAEKYGIDTSRIAISGCSAGGQLAALIGITNGQAIYEDKREYAEYASTIQAVINIDGVTDMTKAELANNKIPVDKSKPLPAAVRWLGPIEENHDKWIEASSLYHITRQSPPICFINSIIPRFHDGRDEAIEKMNQYNIYSEVHEIPDTPHPFWLFKPWFEVNVNYMVGFLDKVFKNKD